MMSGNDLTRNEVIQLLLRVGIASFVTFFSLKYLMNALDPTKQSKKKAKNRAEHQLKRLKNIEGVSVDTSSFSEYELVIASHLIIPEDITVTWKDIAGLDTVIRELRESVVLPIHYRSMFQKSQLYQAPKGVLLHGPPGCGKTLIAKATAKEAGMRFINLDVAMLTDKWYGESQKLASAVFTLAEKLQPCIIFIDEIESFLRCRNVNDHEATAMMKTQFMALWDGLSTESGLIVIVMGATNRPQDLDKAILRRMPAQFHIGLPSEEQRGRILRLILSTEAVAEDVDFPRLAKLTTGFSGSDLRELCRHASVYRIRELMDDFDSAGGVLRASTSASRSPPAISMADLLSSFAKMRENKLHTGLLMAQESRIDLD
ncbi:outer mitochondrial transmembrane helix translocase [Phlebotomus papatasi]|uniref:outer mitochondrial transmembrane helix translocase n=1 Tax=Phlebotomus papatasi TaxID=29031 RepID=UPI0024837520|nr:outer mitochondrial transmembrane helix translocase [Phlebotomus papatasi]